MKIESEKIGVLPFDRKRCAHLKPDQLEILELFRKSYSIFEVTQYFFSQGILVSFQTLLQVIEFLLQEKLIVNENFYSYFKKEPASQGLVKKLSESLLESFYYYKDVPPSEQKSKIEKIKDKAALVPFFRSLSPEVLEVFLQNSNLISVPAGVLLCQQGASQRSMLVLLRGEATVYKNENPRKKIVVLSKNSVFGETGFFFGEPRSATVQTDKDCEVLVIKYVPEIFDRMIKTEKARQLQLRIWAIHALLRSQHFRDLPQECFDALIFSGEFKTVAAKSIICKQGENGKTSYVIVQGSVNVSIDSVFVRSLTQGDTFGEIALTLSQGKRTATVQAITELLVLEISMENFYRLMSQNLLLACEIEKLALQRLSST